MARTDLSIVRRHACPKCESTDALYVVDRHFSYRAVSSVDGAMVIAPRGEAKFVQEVAILCRQCEYVHDLRTCTQTIEDVLTGKAGCNHG